MIMKNKIVIPNFVRSEVSNATHEEWREGKTNILFNAFELISNNEYPALWE